MRERTTTNAGHTVGNRNRAEAGAKSKCTFINGSHAIFNDNRAKACAAPKRSFTNIYHAFAYGNRIEAGAFFERRRANIDHAVSYDRRAKAGAISERPITNMCHTVGDGDGSKIPTRTKSILGKHSCILVDGIAAQMFIAYPNQYGIRIILATYIFAGFIFRKKGRVTGKECITANTDHTVGDLNCT